MALQQFDYSGLDRVLRRSRRRARISNSLTVASAVTVIVVSLGWLGIALLDALR